eukprot:TRINITY_DN40770_c0_g1_i1.p1 TRINITY_DN40770_c0_g1~~TRINITY_DN40770_c0_g1_i1.p1  ORF type:complete len:430 (+),score=64.76 TRINITY_DN40770_c0_g1_i1:42-1331(+)
MFAKGNKSACDLVPPPTPSVYREPCTSLGPRTAVGAHSLTSFGKGTNENQDAFITSTSDSGSKCFVGVFDGHGEQGHKISQFARGALSKNLFSRKDLHSDPKQAFQVAYDETQRQIASRHGSEASESGTTAVAAYQHRDRLLVANVGDSRAVLGRCDTSRGTLSAVDLSVDHKPGRDDEKRRIEKAGGRVDQMIVPMNTGAGVRMVRAGPQRVMHKDGMCGLAVSRSLGDLSLQPFVSAQPEVFERKLDNRDKVLVLGTDGVWDHVSSQEAVDIAGRVNDPQLAAHEITKVARQRWQSETHGMLSDDITAVVVRLDKTQGAAGPSRPGSSLGLAPEEPLTRRPSSNPVGRLLEETSRRQPGIQGRVPGEIPRMRPRSNPGGRTLDPRLGRSASSGALSRIPELPHTGASPSSILQRRGKRADRSMSDTW